MRDLASKSNDAALPVLKQSSVAYQGSQTEAQVLQQSSVSYQGSQTEALVLQQSSVSHQGSQTEALGLYNQIIITDLFRTYKINLELTFWCHKATVLKPTLYSWRNMQSVLKRKDTCIVLQPADTSFRSMQSVQMQRWLNIYLATFFSLIVTDDWSRLWFTLRFGSLCSLLENRQYTNIWKPY